MKARRYMSALVSAAVLVGLAGVVMPAQADAAPLALTARADNPSGTMRALRSVNGFQDLIDAVTRQVHAQYPNAIFVDAVGSSPSGPTRSITDVTTWQFNFNDANEAGRPIVVRATVFLPSWAATITVVPNTIVLAEELTSPVRISPFKASLLLRQAGYDQPFRTVVYAQPTGPAYPHPLFLVDQGGSRVAVDTVTRSVAPFPYSRATG